MGSRQRPPPCHPPRRDGVAPSVFFYISGHGFGHAARQIEVINALGALRYAPAIVVRTAAPRWFFQRTVRAPFTLIPGPADTGIVQADSLRLDEAATIAKASAFYERFPEMVRSESEVLRRENAQLVIADAPPLACVAAEHAGIPSVVLANFTWDWIYEAYAEHVARAPELIPTIRNAYSRARAGWRLPMAGGFDTVPDVVDLPYVARHASRPRDEVRAVLGLPLARPLVLASFGGYGIDGLDATRLDCLDRFSVVLTGVDDPKALLPGVHFVDERRLYAGGLRYEDVVGAVDVVVTKPGYGIISECIANGAAMLYTSRGRFREYDVMVAELPRVLRCGYIDQDALFGGRWRAALDSLLELPPPPDHPPTDGAEIAAAKIMRLLGG